MGRTAGLLVEIEQLNREIAACWRCALSHSRSKSVPGEGNCASGIMLVGEAPGWWEDQEGRPFVGPAGQLLDELLLGVPLQRSQVFIANVVKCRPPGNRDPVPEEIEACSSFLDRQIDLLRPRLIVALGRHSTARFFGPGKSMKDLHGTTVRRGSSLCLAMYHPAAVLRQPSLRATLEEDFKRIPALLKRAQALSDDAPAQTRASQLALF